jgi:hypothetical protein
MAKEKQKEIEPEPEVFINPRMKSMCEYERRQNPEGCKDCDGIDIMDGLYCKTNTIAWRLSQIDKNLQSMNSAIIELIRITKEK